MVRLIQNIYSQRGVKIVMAYAVNKGPDQNAHAYSDQGLRCQQAESVTSIECILSRENPSKLRR